MFGRFFRLPKGKNKRRIFLFADGRGPTLFISFLYLFGQKGLIEGEDYYVFVHRDFDDAPHKTIENINNCSKKGDIFVFTRFGHQSCLSLLNIARAKDIKTINHLDDCLFAHPPADLGGEVLARHGVDAVVNLRKSLITSCDQNYLSTEFLEKKVAAIFQVSNTVSGIYLPYFSDLLPARHPKVGNKFIFGYMASKGHIRDLRMILPDVVRFLEKYPDSIFHVFGSIALPEELLPFGERVQKIEPVKNYHGFLKRLSELNWSVGLCPLIDDDWNRCKAPTKVVEYSICGVVPVASNMPVYSEYIKNGKTGFLVADSKWFEVLSEIYEMQRGTLSVIHQRLEVELEQLFSFTKFEKQVSEVIGIT